MGNLINNIACINTKCILLPTCKYKNVISCELLYDSIRYTMNHDFIRDYFPNLQVIDCEEMKYTPIIVRRW